jgi:hypothetical protein
MKPDVGSGQPTRGMNSGRQTDDYPKARRNFWPDHREITEMKLRDLLGVAMTILALALFVGCQTSSAGGGGSGSSGTDTTNGDEVTPNGGESAGDDDEDAQGGGDDINDAEAEGEGTEVNDEGDGNDSVDDGEDADNTTEDEEEPTLTEEEEEAVESTMTAIGDLTVLFAALGAAELPSLDERPIVINPFTGCPTLSSDEPMTFTIDYGDGCTPALYPDSTLAGSISGQINADDSTVTLTFNDFTVDGETISGTVVASISQDEETVALEADIDVTFTGDGHSVTYTGDATVEIDPATGEMFIPYANLAATDDTGDTYAIILEDVHIDLIEVLPDSGTATVVLGTEGPGALTVVITFTQNTPVNGEVLVSVNGSQPVSVSLDEIDLDP